MKTALFIIILTLSSYSQDILLIEFSEPMDTTGIRNVNNYVLNFKPSPLAAITSIYNPVRIDSIGFTQFDSVILLFTSEHPDTIGVYQIRVFNLFDLAGNEINLSKNYAYY